MRRAHVSVRVCVGVSGCVFVKRVCVEFLQIKDLLASHNKEMFLVDKKFERKQKCQAENENESFGRNEKEEK